MDRDWQVAFGDLERLGMATEDLHRLRHHQLLGDLRQRIMVSADRVGADAGLVQPPQLTGQKRAVFIDV